MGLFKIDNITSIKFKNSVGLSDGTLNSKYLCLVDGFSNKVIVANEDLTTYTSIKTNKVFDKITYDNKENCFWAYSEAIIDCFFKLDEHMNELGTIHIPNCNSKKIDSLNYNHDYDCLTISSCGNSANINKNSILVSNIVLPHFLFTTCTYCFDNLNVSLCRMNSINVLSLFDENKKIALFKLPEHIKYQSIIHAHKKSNMIYLKLLILDTKNYSYISDCSINLDPYFNELEHDYYLEDFTYECGDLRKIN